MIPSVLPTYNRAPLSFVKGEGAWLFEADGRRFLDLGAGIAVNALGHANPDLVKTLTEQAERLWHVSNIYKIPEQEKLANLLIDKTFADTVFFTNSGTETAELAIKMARRHHFVNGQPDRFHIVSFEGAFHGRTMAAINAGGNEKYLEGFGPRMAGFDQVPLGDLDALKKIVGPHTAALIIEPLQGEGGVRPVAPEFLRALRKLCDDTGMLLIFDEIQTGAGRTGEWFGFQHFGVEPDVVTMAKALGNGVPIGACWAKKDVAAVFQPGDHGTTYGGQPLAASAARATLAILERINAPQLAEQAGAQLRHSLEIIDGVVEVRGLGLLLAAELAEGIDSKAVAADLLSRGLIVNAVSQTALRFAPPLIVSESEIEQAVDLLSAVLATHLTKAQS